MDRNLELGYKIALFKMINQFMYRYTDESGNEFFDDYCESAGEAAFSMLGFEDDRISFEDFYRLYDEVLSERAKLNGVDNYDISYLNYYLEEKKAKEEHKSSKCIKILNVTALVNEIKLELRKEIASFRFKPKVAVLTDGYNYISDMISDCRNLGIEYRVYTVSKNSTESEILKLLIDLNLDKSIDSIIISESIKAGIDNIYEYMNPDKDVQCLTDINIGRLYRNKPLFTPCNAMAVIDILKYYKIGLDNLAILVLGNIHVNPLLLNENSNIISHSPDNEYISDIDVIVYSAHSENVLDNIEHDTLLIDLVGDIDISKLSNKQIKMVSKSDIDLLIKAELFRNIIKAYKMNHTYK